MSDNRSDGPERLLLPKSEAFKAIGIGPTTGAKLIKEGRLHAVKLGAKTMVPRQSLAEFIAGLPSAARAA